MADMEWYPTPSYLVKRRVILEHVHVAGCAGGSVLEVGCGCGDLLHVLEASGYTGLGIDLSVDALAVARKGLTGPGFRLACAAPEEINEQFDMVIASEVMEHCQDDAAFLSSLHERLNTGGCLLLTVPAHMKDWGANDDVCGHIRRYERHELSALLEKSGFDNVEIRSYGVPVYNIMKPFYDRAVRASDSTAAIQAKTTRSAGMFLLPDTGWLFRLLFNDVTMYPFYLLQKLFFRTDLGKGYFAAARKKELK